MALILTLVVGVTWIIIGLFLLQFIIFLPLDLFITGGLFLLIACWRILFVSKKKIIEAEIQAKVADELYQEEVKKEILKDKRYESYEWVRDESLKILQTGRVADGVNLSKIITALDSNYEHPDLKALSRKLKILEQQWREELEKKMSSTQGYF